ncbi:molybdopterin molybdotransferase MoeA [Senegalia massiliensis]|uniref:molybdopterin molybdotransferase MoeA n=1 Tax=Senegalia massiliensis TaxID=1720316 RepID=UPI0010300AFC|nr:molybdopterin molybdotransferase MoeA [Senegalia massiliensis]
MVFSKLDSIDQAKSKFKKGLEDFLIETEKINIIDGLDRILAEDIKSNIDIPEFNRSTKDGYAIRCSNIKQRKIIGQVNMGEKTDLEIKSNQAIYIPTGGMVPKGSDGIIMIEDVHKKDNILLLNKKIFLGENINFKGDEMKKGELLFSKGRKLTPSDIGTFASIGMSKIEVYKKLEFSIISTGDEIVDIDSNVGNGKIRDVNKYSLSTEIKRIGGKVSSSEIVKDDFELIRKATKRALEISDIVLISGGSSVGKKDYTLKVIESFDNSEVFVHGVSIKPGKPTIISKVGEKIVIGLPGHPTSSLIVFKAFIENFLNEKLNVDYGIRKIKAIIKENFENRTSRETYQLVSLEEDKEAFYATPIKGTSGMIYTLSKSHGYVIIKGEEEGLKKGEKRDVFFL